MCEYVFVDSERSEKRIGFTTMCAYFPFFFIFISCVCTGIYNKYDFKYQKKHKNCLNRLKHDFFLCLERGGGVNCFQQKKVIDYVQILVWAYRRRKKKCIIT